MTTDPEAILKAYHQKYCDLTGTQPKFNLWLRSWYEFQKAGFDVSDLECVLKWIARENRKNDFQRSNSLMKLIGGDLTQFDSLLCEARATERNRREPRTAARADCPGTARQYIRSRLAARSPQYGHVAHVR